MFGNTQNFQKGYDMNQDHVDYPIGDHDVLLMCLDPVALAYQWIIEYAKNLSDQVSEDDYGGDVTVDDLMQAADSHQNGGWGDYISRGGAFEGQGVDSTFWAKYAIVRGKEIDSIEQAHFFSCSC